MISFSRLKVRHKLALMMMVSVSIAFTIAAYAYIHFVTSVNEREFYRGLDELCRLKSNALVEPLWNYDEATASSIIQIASENDHFVYARVNAQDGSTFVEYGNSKDAERNDIYILRFDLVKDNYGKSELIGKVTFFFTESHLLETKRNVIAVSIFVAACIIGVLYVVLIIPVGYVTRPLGQMVDVLNQLATAKTNIKIPDYKYEDEIADIRNALIFFRENNAHRYNTILNNIDDGVIEVNGRGEITLANEDAAELLRFKSPADMLGRPLIDVLNMQNINSPDHSDGLYSMNKKSFSDEVLFSRQDKTCFDAEFVSTPIRDQFNTVSGAVMIFRDISLRKRMEEREQEARRKAEDTNRLKSEFLANMSHELRTPLNSLLLLTKALVKNKKGNLDESQLRDLNIIFEGGNNLLNIINDILDLSKVEAGMLNINREEVSIPDMLIGLESFFKPVASAKNVKLILNRKPGSPRLIMSDYQRIEQIIRNFMSNALKFTDEGSVALTVFIEENTDSSEKDMICFSVKDTGMGISEDNLEAIFEAFQQEDGSVSRKYGGTGLGLSISRDLAKLLGGDILLESKKGEGSTFTLKLPLEIAKNNTFEPEEAIVESDESESEEDDRLNGFYKESIFPLDGEMKTADDINIRSYANDTSMIGKRILIVDSDMRTVYSLEQKLMQSGADVVVATTLDKADSEIHAGTGVDLVLLGKMAKTNELCELLNEWRDMPMLSESIFVYADSLFQDKDLSVLFEHGISAALIKPVAVDDLASLTEYVRSKN